MEAGNSPLKKIVQDDPWQSLKAFTPARIALGRTGSSVPLNESLDFKMAHAEARDAVYAQLDAEAIISGLLSMQIPFYHLRSMAESRHQYLQRPDLGRQLHHSSILQLPDSMESGNAEYEFDIAIIIADGLSATAINHHAIPLLRLLIFQLKGAGISFAPVVIAEQARVAIADPIGFLLKAAVSIILIGERPGLSSADSMGVYLTYAPMSGKTDASRNCISNIRPEGLKYAEAVVKIMYLIQASIRLQCSGVQLKENSKGELFP